MTSPTSNAVALVDLAALAEAATPGPWRHFSHGLPVFKNVEHLVESQAPGVNEGDGLICVTNAPNNRDAAYIAAANPQAVLGLIAELQSQAARIAELERENARLLNAFDGIVDEDRARSLLSEEVGP